MPSHVKEILASTMKELTKATKHVHKFEEMISEHNLYEASTITTYRNLSTKKQSLNNNGKSSTKYHFHSGVSKADYHHRAKSRHLEQGYHHHGLGNIHSSHLGKMFGHQAGHQASDQQGYHGARALREEGRTTHRRLQDNSNICLPASQEDRKIEQCFRLAICAGNYGLYDMFAFSFADDLDFDSGGIDDELRIRIADEVDIDGKVRKRVMLLSYNSF